VLILFKREATFVRRCYGRAKSWEVGFLGNQQRLGGRIRQFKKTYIVFPKASVLSSVNLSMFVIFLAEQAGPVPTSKKRAGLLGLGVFCFLSDSDHQEQSLLKFAPFPAGKPA
jgi:hypothetical protein